MLQLLKTLTAPEEDLSLAPSTHRAAHHLWNPTLSPLISMGTRHIHHDTHSVKTLRDMKFN